MEQYIEVALLHLHLLLPPDLVLGIFMHTQVEHLQSHVQIYSFPQPATVSQLPSQVAQSIPHYTEIHLGSGETAAVAEKKNYPSRGGAECDPVGV